MDFDYSPKTKELQAKLLQFMDEHIYPAEADYTAELQANTAAGKRWSALNTIENLKPKAQAAGLWNLFLPVDSAAASGYAGAGLTNQEYAPLAEIMGRVPWASEVFNCSAPDTGNMETIARYGSEENKARWLKPLLEGKIRSAFAMTEPAVASSDATNIETRIERQGDEYVINGRKWWISGAADPRCAVFITMGKSDPEAPKHSQQSMVLVPADTPGIKIIRPLNVFGYDDAPHGHVEMTFENVRVPVSNILLGEGRGFEIAQGRLGPGRIHHCMRLIGLAERAQKSQFGVPQALLRHQNPAQLAQAVQPVGRQLQGGVDGVFGFAQALLPVAHLRQRSPGFGLRGRLRHCPLGMAAGLGQVAQRGVHKSCLDMGVGVVRRAGLQLMHHGQRQRGIVLFQRQPGQHAHGFGVARVVPQGAL